MSIKSKSDIRTSGRRKGDRHALTTADLIVLSLLSERPMHGYELIREYERQEVEDWATISRPHVYYALQKLAGARLIDGTPEHDGDRARVVYCVQPSGQAALADALASPDWATTAPPTPFRTWLGLSIHARAEDVHRMVEARRSFLAAEIERETVTMEGIRSDSSPRARVGEAMVSLVIRQYETELAWLDEWTTYGFRAALVVPNS
jgi:DNA-binding PadR family transcriptional regulator